MLFALFVNIFGIEGKFQTKGNCAEAPVNNYLFTDDKYSYSEDTYQSNFWPFVDFFYHSRDKETDWCADPYFGMFRYFDYSELLAYSSIFLIILYLFWTSVRGSSIKTKKIKNAFWADLINGLKSKGTITNGLTIPYLVGSLNERYNMPPNKETLKSLIENLINSSSETKPVFPFCDDINEYVIATKSEEFCDKNFQNEFCFRNVTNAKTMYITQSTLKFGTTKDAIIDNLWDKYGEQIEHKLFSWRSLKQQWFPFEEREKHAIWEV